MRGLNSIFAKFCLALLGTIFLSGALFYAYSKQSSRSYHAELSQRLNGSIAMYISGQSLLIENGQINHAGLSQLTERAMIVNPSAEIYLLDPTGKVLNKSPAQHALTRPSVEIAPLKQFLDQTRPFPIYGSDPLGGHDKVFSTWPIETTKGLEGYIYVILGGRAYEAQIAEIGNSYSIRTGALAILGIMILTLVLGLLVFSVLTSRIRTLNREAQRLINSNFEAQPQIKAKTTTGDEIDQLTQTFIKMSGELRDKIGQLKDNDRQRRELISNISHDLRTPLSALQGFIDTVLAKSDLTNTDRERFLQSAQKHGKRLNVLIGDLFELSKLESISALPETEIFCVAELVQDIGQTYQTLSEQKQITLDVTTDGQSCLTRGNISLIHRALENLLINALDAVQENGTITISIKRKLSEIIVSVSDNGPGISEQDLVRIFDRFYQDKAPKRKHSSGLGLAIVKRIMDLHGAPIDVISRINQGTRFQFVLPMAIEGQDSAPALSMA